jgi:hypothetical protein
VCPRAFEVVIRPPPPSRQNALHDLDNVLRNYLIPRVVAILKPISDYAFTLNEKNLKENAPRLAERFDVRAAAAALDKIRCEPVRGLAPAARKGGRTRLCQRRHRERSHRPWRCLRADRR